MVDSIDETVEIIGCLENVAEDDFEPCYHTIGKVVSVILFNY